MNDHATDTSKITELCRIGHHGTTERRYQSKGADMWTGQCAGTYRSLTGTEGPCPCHCHALTPTSRN